MRLLRVAAVFVVMVIAACAALHLGEASQESVVYTSDLANNDFGDVQIGMSSAPATITISPGGTTSSNDTITMVMSSSPEFVLGFPNGSPPQTVTQTCSGSGSGSGPGTGSTASPERYVSGVSGSGTGGCTANSWSFTVTFSPTGSPSLRHATISVYVNGTAQVIPIQMMGNAVAPPYLIDVSPMTLPFGDVRTGASSTSTITVKNIGSQPLMISASSITGATGSVFSVVSGTTGMHTLAAGTMETYGIQCAPITTILYTGTFSFTSNATNMPATSVGLSCTGTDSNLTATPNAFGAIAVGGTASLTVHVKNTGTAGVSYTSATLAADATPDLTVTNPGTAGPLGPGGQTDVALSYMPKTPVGPNGFLGTLVIHYDDSGPKTYNASIFGEADSTAMSVSTGAVDFGPLCVGQSATQHVTAYASDVGAFYVTDVAPPALPFMTTPSGMLMQHVQGNHTGTDFALDVSITAAEAKPYSSSLTISTDIPNAQPFQIALTAQGLPAGISPTPAMVDFPPTTVGGRPTTGTVVLSNCGSGTINVTNAQIMGLDENDFAIVLPTNPAQTLQVHDSEMFALVMSPSTPGLKNATLVITYDTGDPTMVPLDGNAGADVGSGKDRETYYACSTGRPGGLWPFALALAALLRRRRAR